MLPFKSGSSSHTSASSTSDHLSAFLRALVARVVACIARVAVRNSSYLLASFHRSDCLPWKRLKVEMWNLGKPRATEFLVCISLRWTVPPGVRWCRIISPSRAFKPSPMPNPNKPCDKVGVRFWKKLLNLKPLSWVAATLQEESSLKHNPQRQPDNNKKQRYQ